MKLTFEVSPFAEYHEGKRTIAFRIVGLKDANGEDLVVRASEETHPGEAAVQAYCSARREIDRRNESRKMELYFVCEMLPGMEDAVGALKNLAAADSPEATAKAWQRVRTLLEKLK